MTEKRIGPVTVLFGEAGGKYPSGNSLLVRGARETVLIDPSLGVLARRDHLPRVDRILNSHSHEDHVAGNHLFPDVPWHVHELDRLGLLSLEGLMQIYGMGPEGEHYFRDVVVKQFHYLSRPDVEALRDGDDLDLGGVTVRVLHTPGHTRGHCCFLIEWPRQGDEDARERLLYLGDIELTSFGPYYGDAWSSLEDFERSLALVRDIDADWYATFHHIGVLDGRAAYLARLDRFIAVIADRERRLLEYLDEPRTLDEIAQHRFVYRPQDPVPYAEAVERRSMGQHLERLVRAGSVRSLDGARFQRAAL